MALACSVVLGFAAIIVLHDPLSACSSLDRKLTPAPYFHVLPLERASPTKQGDSLETFRSRDRDRHVRMLQGDVDLSVKGSSDPFKGGIYYTKVKLGTPPKDYYVQIDTGSDVLWVTCSSCSNCPITSQLGIGLTSYDPSASWSATPVSCTDPICTSSKVSSSAAVCLSPTRQCGYSFKYGDGSGTSGYYVSDDIYFNITLDQSTTVNSSASVTFGCSTYQSGDLVNTDKAVDGILGLGPGHLSVVSQLSSRAVFARVFSHCLRGDDEGGGTMIIGDVNDPNIVYSPLVPSQPHYNLKMQSIAVNGQVLAVNPAAFATSKYRGTIVDSGTTLTYLVEEAYHPFVTAVNASVAQMVTLITVKEAQCYLVASSRGTGLESFPAVSLNFDGGASMQLTPEQYLVSIGSTEGSPTWCIGFQKAQHGVSILGDLVLKDKIIVYDLEQQRIGWANYNCSMSMNISAGSGRDKLFDFNDSNLEKETRVNLLTAIVSSLLLYFGWS